MKSIIRTILLALQELNPGRTQFNSQEITKAMYDKPYHPLIKELRDNTKADQPFWYPQYITQLLTQTQKRKTITITRTKINNRFYYSLKS